MLLKIPALSSLYTFAAVGNHLSFRKAADELLLTPGAVSQKIKALEGQLGCKLFRRTNREVSFTTKGKAYFEAVSPLLHQISEVTQDTFGGSEKRSIVVSVMPAFALRWLIPRMESFHKSFPDITVNINASAQLVDFATDDVDLAVRHGLGSYPGLKSAKLFTEGLIPVCSPKLLNPGQCKFAIADIKGFTLLHDNIGQDWNLFLTACGIKDVDANLGPKFDGDSLMIEAAVEGHGIALAHKSLVKNEIDRGRLLIPFDHEMPSEFAYYAVYPKIQSPSSCVRLFRDWLLEEAQAYSETR